MPVEDYPVHPDVKVQTGIRYSQYYAEPDACIAAGCDLWRWRQGEYPGWFKAEVMVWYAKRSDIALNVEDARYRKQKKLSKTRR